MDKTQTGIKDGKIIKEIMDKDKLKTKKELKRMGINHGPDTKVVSEGIEFRDECLNELGDIAILFMNKKGKMNRDMFSRTEEITEAVDRIELYLFREKEKALSSQREQIISVLEGMIETKENKYCYRCGVKKGTPMGGCKHWGTYYGKHLYTVKTDGEKAIKEAISKIKEL